MCIYTYSLEVVKDFLPLNFGQTKKYTAELYYIFIFFIDKKKKNSVSHWENFPLSILSLSANKNRSKNDKSSTLKKIVDHFDCGYSGFRIST